MINIPLFESGYDWITLCFGAVVTIVFYILYFSKYKSQQLLNSLPGIWTSLGLLFTFISICESMQNLQNAPDPVIGQVLTKPGETSIDIKRIIGDIIPAFTTSIIGLVAGLCITIVNKCVYFRDEAKEALEKDTPEEHIKGILTASNLITERMVELKTVQEQNQEKMKEYNENLNNNVAEQNQILQGFIDGFVNRMDEIFTQMNGAIKNQIHEFGEEQFVKSSEVLNGIIDKLSTQSTSLLEEQKNSVEKMVLATSTELNDISSKLSNVVDSLSISTTEALQKLGENQSTELQGLATRYDALAERLVTQNQTFADSVNQLMSEQFSAVETKSIESLEKMTELKDSYQTVCSDLLNKSTETIQKISENQSTELQGLATRYDALAERLVTQNQTFADSVNQRMTEQFAVVESKNAESLEKMTELKDSYQEACSDLLNRSTEANQEIINEIKGSFGTFVKELQSSLASQCTLLSKSIADNVKILDGAYSFMKGHLAEMVTNYEQSAEAFKDAVNVAHRTNENSENVIVKVTDALENMKVTNENIEKVIASVSTKQANVDKIIANIKEMNSTIEALQQLESVLNRIARK